MRARLRKGRALCVRDVWFSEQHVLTTPRVRAKWMNTDRSHARVPHRTSRAASHASREARGVPSSVQGSGASRLARSPCNLLPTASIGRLGASQHDPPAPASNAPSFSVVSSVADSVWRRRLPPRSHRRGAQHHLPGDRHDLAPRRRRTSPWWSRGLWLERDLPRKRVTRAGARLPREEPERGTLGR